MLSHLRQILSLPVRSLRAAREVVLGLVVWGVACAVMLSASVLPAWHAAQHAHAYPRQAESGAPRALATIGEAHDGHGCEHSCSASTKALGDHGSESRHDESRDTDDCPTCELLLLARAQTALITPPPLALLTVRVDRVDAVACARWPSRPLLTARSRGPPRA
jgi:hypothetical protein